MKPPHSLLTPVPPGPGLDDLAGFEVMKEWAANLSTGLFGPVLLRPRAILFVGFPGAGKGSCCRAIAGRLDLPVWRFDAGHPQKLAEALEAWAGSDRLSVLWLDGLNAGGHALGRWLSVHAKLPGLVIATTEDPQRLAEPLLRAGVFDRVFHFDLLDVPAKAALWDAVLTRFGLEAKRFDHVLLAQASGLFTPGEIIAVVKNAVSNRGEVDEARLLDALSRTTPLATRLDDELADIRSWAKARGILAP